jgi:hypothetical protein
MGLDIFLEADDALTIPKLEQAASVAGACEVRVKGDNVEAMFASGLALSAEGPGHCASLSVPVHHQLPVRTNLVLAGQDRSAEDK